ncbi:MAG: hypothetical protein QXR97_01850, partial [Thermoproteota archaeon]
MKRYLIIHPWVHFIVSSEGYGVVYDLFHQKIYVFNRDETKVIKTYLENHEIENLSISVIDRFLSLDLGFLSDEQLYIDKIRVGSPLIDLSSFQITPSLQELELVMSSGNCPYRSICPLTKSEIIPSFPCKMCYMGKECGFHGESNPNNMHFEEIIDISRKLAPTAIVVNGITFQEDGKIMSIINSLMSNVRPKAIICNIPSFDIIYRSDLINEILSKFASRDQDCRFLLNISLFPEERESFMDFLKIVYRNEVLFKYSVATLCFDFNNLA